MQEIVKKWEGKNPSDDTQVDKNQRIIDRMRYRQLQRDLENYKADKEAEDVFK